MSQPAHPHLLRRDLPTSAGPLALLEAGAGAEPRPVVLFVPGYTGSKEDFLPLLAALADAGYRAVAMDQRGQFESPGPDSPHAYTVPALGADVLTVLAHLTDLADRPTGAEQPAGPGRVRGHGRQPVAHLVGHSFGGLVARAAVVADPGAVSSLVLLGSGPSRIEGARREHLHALEPVLAAHGMPGVYAAMEHLAGQNGRAAVPPPALRAFLRRRFLASSPVGLQAMGNALRSEPDRVAALRASGVPVLVAHGEHDDAWPPAVQAEMAARLDAPHVVIPSAMHSPAVENPAETIRALLGFWSTVQATT